MKHDIKQLQLEKLCNFTDSELLKYAETHLKPLSSWLLPQLVAQFATWKHCSDFVISNTRDNPLNLACWRLMRLPRSALIKTQTQLPHWAQLTPLLLLSQKLQHGTTYERWRHHSELQLVLEPQLQPLVHHSNPQLSPTELLCIRNRALVIHTGRRAGQTRNPESASRLYHVADTPLAGLDPLAQVIVTQCWLAHPKLRNTNQILDLDNWDRVPPQLVESLYD